MRVPAVLVACSLLLAGCLERKETITIQKDGTVEVSYVLKGDPGEFGADRVDALPSGTPWTVTDEDVAKSDGSGSDHVRHAKATFAKIEDAPQSNGAADDPAPLRVKTTLRIEAAKDGATRYVFERRYVPRAYAWRERIFRRTVPEDVIKALNENKEGPGHDQAVRRATEALLAFEREKNQTLLEEALGGGDTVTRLAAREKLGKSFDARWSVEGLLPILQGTAEERAALDRRFKDETANDAVAAGVAAGATEADVKAAFVRERRKLEATEDLQDESFEVRVAFPVPVTLSDADSVEGKTAIFKFSGKDLCDSERVLRAVAEGKP
jgi:hypothetical protein